MRIDKYFYVKLPNVPKEIEEVYNRMMRREQYLYERDIKNSLVYYGSEDELYDISPNAETSQERCEAESKKMKYLIALDFVLVELKAKCPEDYTIIREFFLDDKKITYEELGQRHGYSKQTAYKKIKNLLQRLRELINMHINSD